jgi:hypothetical protein
MFSSPAGGSWAGAILTAVGGKLTVFEVLLSEILNKFGRQLATTQYALPRFSPAPLEPVVAEVRQPGLVPIATARFLLCRDCRP